MVNVNKLINQKNSHKITDISQYPGSIKGPLPKDDPETFMNWFISSNPPDYIKLVLDIVLKLKLKIAE